MSDNKRMRRKVMEYLDLLYRARDERAEISQASDRVENLVKTRTTELKDESEDFPKRASGREGADLTELNVRSFAETLNPTGTDAEKIKS